MGKDIDEGRRSFYRQSAKVISIDKMVRELTMGKTTT